MPQTLPPDFNTVLRDEIKKFEAQCTFKTVGQHGVPSVSHPDFGESGGDCSLHELWEGLLAEAGFTELELGLTTNYGHGRWTYAQYTMARALARAGWSRRLIGEAIGKSRSAVIGLLWRGTRWSSVSDRRQASWTKENTETVIRLRDACGMMWRDIGKALGYSDVYCRMRYREAKNRIPEEPFVARV